MHSKILIIAPYAFGYTTYIKQELKRKGFDKAEIVYLDSPAFAYRGIFHKISNFFVKLFLGKNLKKEFVNDRIKKTLKDLGQQDFIFIIRPDMLSDGMLAFIKQSTLKFVAYYWDSTRRFPRKVQVSRFFDTVYTYDRQDAEQYGYKFLTNYIFKEDKSTNYKYIFFNVSTHDYRFPLLEKLGSYLGNKGYSYTIKVYSPDQLHSDHVEMIQRQLSVEEVESLIIDSKIIVEIQRTEQVGLSFRIFEAMGYRKKLITTNKDIINYDFYNPDNILVIDEDNIIIPDSFVETPYQEIDDKILQQYRIENWVKKVFELRQ